MRPCASSIQRRAGRAQSRIDGAAVCACQQSARARLARGSHSRHRRGLRPFRLRFGCAIRIGASHRRSCARPRWARARSDWHRLIDLAGLTNSGDAGGTRKMSFVTERQGGAGTLGCDCGPLRGPQAALHPQKTIDRLLQGCEPAQRLPRHLLRLSRLPVSSPKDHVGEGGQAHLRAQFPTHRQPEGVDAHRP